MTKTLIEKLKEIKEEFERWKKILERMVTNVENLTETTDKTMKEIIKMVKTANETINEIDGFVTKLSTDYDKMRKELDAMKQNRWLKLFGVFRE